MAKFIILVSLLYLVNCLPQSQRNGRPDVSPVANMIASEGYGQETHHVATEDGYLLEMHRIPRGLNEDLTAKEKPIVFMMHGLLSSSLGFIALGSQLSIGYHLADQGFDVWMGNARGTRDSRHHLYLDPDDPSTREQFWDFSWHEIGSIDVPAMIDYVLAVTGQEKLHYIGHSQGGTSFLVMNSVKPEYNDKILTANLLAGVGYMEHFPDEDLASTARLVDMIYSLVKSLGIYELFPPSTDSATRNADLCTGDVNQKDFCAATGMRNLIEHEDIGAYIAGASMKQIAHFGQNIRDKKFRRFHYGAQKNLELYGQITPPEYDLSLITCKVTMHYSMSDHLLHELDVLNMAANMPHTASVRVPRHSFTHTDYIVADDAKALVTNLIINNIWDVEMTRRENLAGSTGGLAPGVLLQAILGVYYLLQ